MKVVKNYCYGGFGLSDLALSRLSEITGKTVAKCRDDYNWDDVSVRTAPELIQVIEELGENANGPDANLVIVNIPDDVDWYIEDYDGWETIEEFHRSW